MTSFRAVYDALRKPLGYLCGYPGTPLRPILRQSLRHLMPPTVPAHFIPVFPFVSLCFLLFPFVSLCFPLFPFVSLLFSFVFLVFLFVSFYFLLFPFVSLCSPPKHIPLGLCVFPGPDLKPQRTFEAYRRRASALALESHQTHVYGFEKSLISGHRCICL